MVYRIGGLQRLDCHGDASFFNVHLLYSHGRYVGFRLNRVTRCGIVGGCSSESPFRVYESVSVRVRCGSLNATLGTCCFCRSQVGGVIVGSHSNRVIHHVLYNRRLKRTILRKGLTTVGNFRRLRLFSAVMPARCRTGLFTTRLVVPSGSLLRLLGSQSGSFFSVTGRLCVPTRLLSFGFGVLGGGNCELRSPVFTRSGFLGGDVRRCWCCWSWG